MPDASLTEGARGQLAQAMRVRDAINAIYSNDEDDEECPQPYKSRCEAAWVAAVESVRLAHVALDAALAAEVRHG